MADPTSEEIQRVLLHLRVSRRVREASGQHAVADCPACGKAKHLYVNEDTGKYDCKKCGQAGALWSLADLVGLKLRERTMVRSAHSVMVTAVPGLRRRDRQVSTMEQLDAAHARLWDENDPGGSAVLRYLRSRGFDDETIKRFRLIAARMQSDLGPETGVGIPYVDGGRVLLVKKRNLATDKDRRRFQRTPGGHSGLFNVDAVRECRQVVLVEGELDAVSLWQLGVTNVASTSLGAQKNLPQDWRDALAQAEEVVLWYDDDEAGEEAVRGLLGHLGTHRCRVASIPDDLSDEVMRRTGTRPKDANDLLRAGVTREQVAEIIRAAPGIDNVSALPLSRWADKLLDEVNRGSEALGVPYAWPALQGLLRGCRPGEVTVITGHTGHGKTTWATQLAESFAGAGHPVLISSLENGPLSVARKCLQRLLRRPLSSLETDADRELAARAVARLDERPIYLLDLQGIQQLDVVLDTLEYARHRLGVRHVLLDHLHHLAHDPRVEERDALNQQIAAISAAAGRLGVHAWVIAHPRGAVEEDTVPDGSSIRGSSSIKQVADNGITVWRARDVFGASTAKETRLKDPSGKRTKMDLGPHDVVVSVWKTRHDEAREGSCVLEFDPRSLTYLDRTSVPKMEPRADPRQGRDNDPQPAALRAPSHDEDPFEGL